MVIVRMPPSPTGSLHLGTARTALFNWLFAKKKNGKIIFRWEDTDRERSKPEFEKEILEGLAWLGMDFEKECKPNLFFRQSENEKVHAEQVKKLWEARKIFPCFVSAEEIETQRKAAEASHKNFVFWSPFRDAERKDLEKKMTSQEKFVWRIKCPKNKNIEFDDLIRGKIQVNSDTLGDFVIARGDGAPLYILANVIDDWTQGVTHVIRGEDHISNTPKQIVIYEALGAKQPEFGHLPFVLDSQRKKLSKRNVDPSICVTIKDFQAVGFVSEAVVNGLALLGWNPKTTEEIFSLQDLEKIFDIKNVNPGAAQYNFDKMKWFNAQWIKRLSIERLIQQYNEFAGKSFDAQKDKKIFETARAKARDLLEITNHLSYLCATPAVTKIQLLSEKLEIDETLLAKVLPEIQDILTKISASDFSAERIKEKAIASIEKLRIKNGQFLNPFRVGLSGREVSAGPFEICEAIGREESLKRINQAIKISKKTF